MKNIKKTLLAALFLVLLCAETAFGYTTPSYAVTVDVGKDNSYQFTETIQVNFDQPQHGIYRYIPMGGMEGQRSPKFDQEWVETDPYEVYEEDGNEIFRIGDADRTVTGRKTYTLGYRMRIADDKDTAKDLLYIDLIPTNWETTIDHADVTVRLPKPIDTDMVELYSGAYGSEDKGERIACSYDEKTRTLHITGRRLAQGEGITVKIDLPEGYWEGQMNYDWTVYALMVVSILIAGLLLVLWFCFGRDPHLVPTVEFYPPQGMTPAEVGYVIDGMADKKDLIALILYFAHHGWLSIEQTGKKDFVLHKTADIPQSEKKFARTFFNGLFCNGDSIALDDLGEDFGDAYLTASEQLSALYHGKKKQISVLSVVMQILGGILCVCLMGAGIVAAALYTGKFSLWFVPGIIGFPVEVICLMALLLFQRKAWALSERKSIGRRMVLWIVNLAAAGLSAVGYASILESPAAGAVFFAGLAIAQFCTVMMEKRTKKSTELLGKILGLRRFIESAELDRINRLVEEDPAYFYDVLPYAYVLGLTDKWAKNFEKINIVQPDWYYGYGNGDLFDAWMFSRMMQNCYSSAAKNIHIAVPEGGDSGGGFSVGGGGFSGGGFGGGGGGAW